MKIAAMTGFFLCPYLRIYRPVALPLSPSYCESYYDLKIILNMLLQKYIFYFVHYDKQSSIIRMNTLFNIP